MTHVHGESCSAMLPAGSRIELEGGENPAPHD